MLFTRRGGRDNIPCRECQFWRPPSGFPPSPLCCNIALMKEELSRKLAPIDLKRGERGIANQAAVLLILNQTDADLLILFTKRSQNLEHHKGEVAFPGGLIEWDDPSPLDAALRETEEEIGLPKRELEILGELPKTETASSRVVISPFVAWGEHLDHFVPNPHEIEKIFQIPLDFLRRADLFQQINWYDGERERRVYSFDYEGERIWGATARILKSFLDLL